MSDFDVNNSTLLNSYTKPYIRDIYYAFLINGARRTREEGYPIIEGYMVAKEPPKNVVQWDQKSTCKNTKETGICFYSQDKYLMPVLNQPFKYLDEFKKYKVVLGMDASPYDNMPPVVQKSQVFINLAFTYFLGNLGFKIIPNVRIGTGVTYDSLEAYPKHHLISIGTNGFIKKNKNRKIFIEQIKLVVDILKPTGILVYGYDNLSTQNISLFEYAKKKGVKIFQYDSAIMKRNHIINATKRKVKRVAL